MTTSLVLKDLLLLAAVFGCGYAVYHEKEIAAFERRAARAIRCFFQAVVLEVKRARTEKQPTVTVDTAAAQDPYLVLLAETDLSEKSARIA